MGGDRTAVVMARLHAAAAELSAVTPGDVAAIRRIVDRLVPDDRPCQGVRVQPLDGPSIRGVWVVPQDADPLIRILYCHGCGFVAGSFRLYAPLLTRLAVAAQACLLFVDYRLAPEHRFPAAHADCLDALRLIRGAGPDGSIPARCVLAGDSCGAAIALGIALEAARGGEVPSSLVLLSPVLDLSASNVADSRGSDPLISREAVQGSAAVYAPDLDARDPRLSPLLADLSPLMRTRLHIQAGSNDPLLGDALRLAARATGGGLPTELHVWSGLPHAWHLYPQDIDDTAAGVEIAGRFLRRR